MFSGLWAGGQHWPGLGLPMKMLSSFHSAAEPWYFPIVMRKLGPKSLEHWIWAPQSWVIPVVKYLFSMFLFCLSKSNFTFYSRRLFCFITFSWSKENCNFFVTRLDTYSKWTLSNKFEIENLETEVNYLQFSYTTYMDSRSWAVLFARTGTVSLFP